MRDMLIPGAIPWQIFNINRPGIDISWVSDSRISRAEFGLTFAAEVCRWCICIPTVIGEIGNKIVDGQGNLELAGLMAMCFVVSGVLEAGWYRAGDSYNFLNSSMSRFRAVDQWEEMS